MASQYSCGEHDPVWSYKELTLTHLQKKKKQTNRGSLLRSNFQMMAIFKTRRQRESFSRMSPLPVEPGEIKGTFLFLWKMVHYCCYIVEDVVQPQLGQTMWQHS